MKLHLYTISQEYYKVIKDYDNVRSLKNDKSTRPFVGVLFKINDCSYFAPLSSPKPKHKTMKTNIDFLKIDKGDLGVINFNNMIPVPKDMAIKIDYRNKNLSLKDLKYYTLLTKQLDWCNKNKEKIINKAINLYDKIQTTKNEKLKARCCEFKKLEEVMKSYINNKNKIEQIRK